MSITIRANPRLISKILEEGSWVDDNNLQGMWAGLLASSCSKTGADDSNLIFINLLSQMTALEAAMLNFSVVVK